MNKIVAPPTLIFRGSVANVTINHNYYYTTPEQLKENSILLVQQPPIQITDEIDIIDKTDSVNANGLNQDQSVNNIIIKEEEPDSNSFRDSYGSARTSVYRSNHNVVSKNISPPGTRINVNNNVINKMLNRRPCNNNNEDIEETEQNEINVEDSSDSQYDKSVIDIVSERPKRLLNKPKSPLSQCEICKKSFKNNKGLMTHMTYHYSRKSDFTCEICDKTFKKRRGLMMHVTYHGVKLLGRKCKKCGKQFNNIQDLNTHSLIHKENDLFQCKICGKNLGHKSSLTYHMGIHDM